MNITQIVRKLDTLQRTEFNKTHRFYVTQSVRNTARHLCNIWIQTPTAWPGCAGACAGRNADVTEREGQAAVGRGQHATRAHARVTRTLVVILSSNRTQSEDDQSKNRSQHHDNFLLNFRRGRISDFYYIQTILW